MSAQQRLYFAQARMQARLNQWPGESTWLSLDPIRDYHDYLESARHTPLRRWLEPIRPSDPVHTIEIKLRDRFGQDADEVSAWIGAPWSEAIDWMRYLPYLPYLQHLLRGQRIYPWMHDDDTLASFLSADPTTRLQECASQACAALLDGAEVAPDIIDAWQAGWRARWPTLPRSKRTRLERLVARLGEVMLAPETDEAADEVIWNRYRRIQAGLLRYFHTHLSEIGAIFAYLGLTALEIFRLRAELTHRQLLAQPTEVAA